MSGYRTGRKRERKRERERDGGRETEIREREKVRMVEQEIKAALLRRAG